MRIAIHMFEARVSPRFDCATEFLVAEVSDGRIVSSNKVPANGSASLKRVGWLDQLCVGAVICGGIEGVTAQCVRSHGIQLYSRVCGDARGALTAFLRGELESGTMVEKDGRCCGRWRFSADCEAV